MKKFITLMNAHSFYYLWHNKSTRNYLETIITNIVGKEKFKLLDTFNDTNGNLKSYIFLESKDRIVYIDFNLHKAQNQILNEALINFIKLSSNKEVTVIIFNAFAGANSNINNIYYIGRNNTNIDEIKLFLSNNYKEQIKYDNYGVTDFLYNLDDNFYQKYLKESEKQENIYNLMDL